MLLIYGFFTLRNVEATIDQPPVEVLWQVLTRQETSLDENQPTMEWDVFISHASEDKNDFVDPLAEALQRHGLRVWYDDFALEVGDSLRRSIDRGLAHSKFGVVVLSPHFLSKEWPQKELDGLVAREVAGVKVILPVWHNITAEKIRIRSPMLADRKATSSSRGIDRVVSDLIRPITKDQDSLRIAVPGSPELDEGLPAAKQPDEAAVPFSQAPSTVSPAHYFDPAEVLVPPDIERMWKESRLNCFAPLNDMLVRQNVTFVVNKEASSGAHFLRCLNWRLQFGKFGLRSIKRALARTVSISFSGYQLPN